MAGSSHTQSSHTIPDYNRPFGVIKTAFTADDTDASIPSLAVTFPYDCKLVQIITNPGSTGPTDNYDIVANDADGADRLLGVGANRDISDSEIAIIDDAGAHPAVLSGESLTIAVSGNLVNSATGTIAIWYERTDR